MAVVYATNAQNKNRIDHKKSVGIPADFCMHESSFVTYHIDKFPNIWILDSKHNVDDAIKFHAARGKTTDTKRQGGYYER